jgi:hypothetical protein
VASRPASAAGFAAEDHQAADQIGIHQRCGPLFHRAGLGPQPGTGDRQALALEVKTDMPHGAAETARQVRGKTVTVKLAGEDRIDLAAKGVAAEPEHEVALLFVAAVVGRQARRVVPAEGAGQRGEACAVEHQHVRHRVALLQPAPARSGFTARELGI